MIRRQVLWLAAAAVVVAMMIAPADATRQSARSVTISARSSKTSIKVARGSRGSAGRNSTRRWSLAGWLRRLRRPAPGTVLDGGWFAIATVEHDGWVRISIKDQIGVWKWTPSRGVRADLARRSVEGAELLRRNGFPVVESRLADDGLSFLRRFADGDEFRDLEPEVQRRAREEARAHIGRAQRFLEQASDPIAREVLIDSSPGNFKYTKDGKVLAWFDPVLPVDLQTYQRELDPRR